MKDESAWVNSMCQMIIKRYPEFKKQLSGDVNKRLVLDTYDSIPVLDKNEIINKLEYTVDMDNLSKKKIIYEMMNDSGMTQNHDKKIDHQWSIEFTSGTSGKRFPILKSARTKMIESRYLLKKRKEINRNATLNNAFLFLHTNQEMIRNMNLWEFKESDLDLLGEALLDRDKYWIFATPLIYKKMVQWLINNKKEVELSKILFCEYTSQGLEEEEKTKYSSIFKTRFINNYGTREFWNIAYECKEGNLHINDEYLYVGLIDENGKMIREDGEVGNIVITHFANKEMCFLKYKLGDRGVFISDTCPCGCTSKIIRLVGDRQNEMLINTKHSGKSVFRRVMRGLYFEDKINDIKIIKIVQDGPYHISVYMDKELGRDEWFENRFVHRVGRIVENVEEFTFDFSYFIPQKLIENYTFKENIFINTL